MNSAHGNLACRYSSHQFPEKQIRDDKAECIPEACCAFPEGFPKLSHTFKESIESSHAGWMKAAPGLCRLQIGTKWKDFGIKALLIT